MQTEPMAEPDPLSETDEADLAALADGRLSPVRRAELERRLASDPRLAQALARQHAGLTVITGAAETVSAPLALRSRVEAMQREAAAPRRRRFALPSWLPAAGLAAAAAAAVLVVVLLGGGPSTETIVAAATRPPVAAVSLDPSRPQLLRDRVESVRFPNYEAKFGWEANGARTDTIEGRDTRTVFYRREGRSVAYTIVAGEALAWPDDAARTTLEGIELRSVTAGDRTVVTWRRQGRTCVMSARGVPRETLLELAAWKGQGAVPF